MAMIGCEVIAGFHLDTKMGPMTCFSQNITKVVSCHNITPMLKSDGMMSKQGPCQGKERTEIPGMCPYKATTFWQSSSSWVSITGDSRPNGSKVRQLYQ